MTSSNVGRNESPVFEVERDRHGITFSRDLRVGECVRVVLVDDLDRLRGDALAAALRAARDHGESKAAAWAEVERLRFELAAAENDAAEARGDHEALLAERNLTQGELDDIAEMLGVERDAPYAASREALATVLREGRPGVMHPVDRAFYDLAIRERDFERSRGDRLERDLVAALGQKDPSDA